jgi:hypothetical protein
MKISNLQRALALILVAAVVQAPLHAEDSYCWKDSRTRGAGTIPTDCAFGTERQGLLCYPTCAAGFTGVANVCWQNCPSGFIDDGAFCRKPAAYGRGAGHAWQIQDGLSNAGMLARCQSAEGRGCEMWGALAYPTCRDGFAAFGANVCTPVCTAGMTDIGVSCAKKTTTRDTIVSSCGAGMVYETGLCYKACDPGYAGVGPVCWGTCPSNLPYQCGAGCAKDIDTCATTTNDQVLSVVGTITDIALTVATAGAGTALKKGIEQGSKVAVNAAAKSLAKAVTKETVKQSLLATAKKVGKEVSSTTAEAWAVAAGSYGTQVALDGAAGVDLPEFNWADLDPTGISGIITAYAHPVCAPPPPGTVVPGTAPTSTIPALPPPPPPPLWRLVSGLANDIGVTESGTAWVTTANDAIFRMKAGEQQWTQMPGLAKRVAAGGETVVVVTSSGSIFYWYKGASWAQLPGWASDAAVDALGNVFVIGKGGSIWELKYGHSVWTALPGLDINTSGVPARIAAAGDTKIRIITDLGTPFAWAAAEQTWISALSIGGAYSAPAPAVDVAVYSDGKMALPEGGTYKAYANGRPTVVTIPGDKTQSGTTILGNIGAVAVGGRDVAWALLTDGRIFKYQ